MALPQLAGGASLPVNRWIQLGLIQLHLRPHGVLQLGKQWLDRRASADGGGGRALGLGMMAKTTPPPPSSTRRRWW